MKEMTKLAWLLAERERSWLCPCCGERIYCKRARVSLERHIAAQHPAEAVYRRRFVEWLLTGGERPERNDR